MEFVCEPNTTLKWISDIRPHLVLERSFEQKRIWERLRVQNEEKLGQGQKIKIVGVISSHFLLLSDQESWVKKIQRDSRYEPKT